LTVTQKPFEWWWSAFGLIFVVIGVLLIKFGSRDRNKNGELLGAAFAVDSRLLGWFFIISASGWILLAFIFTYSTYREFVHAYQTGQYSVIEGVIEDFHPMPYEGHQDECFRVGKEKFCYSDYEVSQGSINPLPMGDPYELASPFALPTLKVRGFKTTSSDLRFVLIVCHQKQSARPTAKRKKKNGINRRRTIPVRTSSNWDFLLQDF
jgi:hypothetical protein